MTIPREILDSTPALGKWCILRMYRGSIAHGMYIPGTDPNSIDDRDIMAVCVPPLDHYIGLKRFGSRGTQEIFEGEWDIVVYEVQKFLNLLAKGNPNVLSMLWLKDEHYLHRTYSGQIIIDEKETFVGKHVYHSFVGYAHDQLKKMTSQSYQGYMGARRKALVDKFGYDTKNAAHLIRLLRMCIEFLQDGIMRTNREDIDAQDLLDIKTGKMSLEWVESQAGLLFQIAREAYDKSPLPEQPDPEKVNQLAVVVIRAALDIRGSAFSKVVM